MWYAANGQMSAMLFSPGCEPVANNASAEEYREIMRIVVADFGAYPIDNVRHLVKVSDIACAYCALISTAMSVDGA
jgi:hypothetical protein